MQSDLSNASQKISLYQVSDPDSNYPADQAAAIAADVIKPNSSMDYVYYGADNTSSPKYYCYMYRKGTETYAVDSTSAVSKGVCLQNLVTNGDFRDGVSGWNTSSTSVSSVNNNELSFIVASKYGGVFQYIPNYANYKLHKLYYSAYVKADSPIVYLILNDGTAQGLAVSTSLGLYQTLSNVFSISSSATSLYTRLQDSRSSGWTTNYIKYWTTIDLTTIFGIGNEPTQAQMDMLITQLPNNWFNITAKVNL